MRFDGTYLFLATMVCFSACDTPRPRWVMDSTVDTVAGVERLTYGEERARPLAWSVDTMVVIGDAMAPPEYQFSLPQTEDLAGMPGGGVVVVDRQAGRILEYAPDGTHRATYGRSGGGPGELRFPHAVALGGTGTIWVNDPGNRRLTGFVRNGPGTGVDREPRVVPYPTAQSTPGRRIERWDAGFLQVIGEPQTGPEPAPRALLRLDESLAVLDTLWVPPPVPLDIVPLTIGGRQVRIGMGREYWPSFHWRAFSDGSVVVSDSADYVYRLIAATGAVRRIVRRHPGPRAVSERDRESARARHMAESGFSVRVDGRDPDTNAQRRMAEARVHAMTFAEMVPRIVRLEVDLHDRIWVGVSEDSAGAVQRIDVYDREGTLLGELPGPFPMPLVFAGPDRIYTVRTDELDVPQIVVLRLTEGDAD